MVIVVGLGSVAMDAKFDPRVSDSSGRLLFSSSVSSCLVFFTDSGPVLPSC